MRLQGRTRRLLLAKHCQNLAFDILDGLLLVVAQFVGGYPRGFAHDVVVRRHNHLQRVGGTTRIAQPFDARIEVATKRLDETLDALAILLAVVG